MSSASRPTLRGFAQFRFVPDESSQIALEPGDALTLLYPDRETQGWIPCLNRRTGLAGWIPKSYTTFDRPNLTGAWAAAGSGGSASRRGDGASYARTDSPERVRSSSAGRRRQARTPPGRVTDDDVDRERVRRSIDDVYGRTGAVDNGPLTLLSPPVGGGLAPALSPAYGSAYSRPADDGHLASVDRDHDAPQRTPLRRQPSRPSSSPAPSYSAAPVGSLSARRLAGPPETAIAHSGRSRVTGSPSRATSVSPHVLRSPSPAATTAPAAAASASASQARALSGWRLSDDRPSQQPAPRLHLGSMFLPPSRVPPLAGATLSSSSSTAAAASSSSSALAALLGADPGPASEPVPPPAAGTPVIEHSPLFTPTIGPLADTLLATSPRRARSPPALQRAPGSAVALEVGAHHEQRLQAARQRLADMRSQQAALQGAVTLRSRSPITRAAALLAPTSPVARVRSPHVWRAEQHAVGSAPVRRWPDTARPRVESGLTVVGGGLPATVPRRLGYDAGLYRARTFEELLQE